MKKFILSLCIIGMIFCQGAVAFASGDSVYVESESSRYPNNTMNDAENIKMESDNILFVYGVVSQDDKEDWYRLNTSVHTGEGTFRFYAPDNMDCEIEIYDGNGKYISSGVARPDTPATIENLYIRANSIYYIKIRHLAGSALSPYKLLIAIDKI